MLRVIVRFSWLMLGVIVRVRCATSFLFAMRSVADHLLRGLGGSFQPLFRVLSQRRRTVHVSVGFGEHGSQGATPGSGACQLVCVWGWVFLVEVGVDAVGVGDGELGQGLVPVGGGLALDESAGGFAVFAFLAAVSLSVGSAFVFDVADP